MRISFSAFDRSFIVDLEATSLFTEDAVIRHFRGRGSGGSSGANSGGSTRGNSNASSSGNSSGNSGGNSAAATAKGYYDEISKAKFFRGRLAGDPDSTAAVTLNNGSVSALIRSNGENYIVEPLSNIDEGAPAGHVAVYRSNDIRNGAGRGAPDIGARCGVVASGPAGGSQIGAGRNTVDLLGGSQIDGGRSTSYLDSGWRTGGRRNTSGLASRSQDGAGQSTAGLAGAALSGNGVDPLVVTLSLVADYELFRILGDSTAAYMHNIINAANQTFMRDLGVSLRIGYTEIFENPADPFSSSSAGGRLSELAAHRAASGRELAATDIAHLISGIDFDASVQGLAYLDGICGIVTGSGVTQYSSDASAVLRVAAHEIAHNLGAFHDGESGSPCASIPRGYLMWPKLISNTALSFSACTSASVGALLASAQCVGAAVPPGCGDGIVSGTEQCDDGNNARGDCCAPDCRFEQAFSDCSDPAVDVCTERRCDGWGHCLSSDKQGSCNDGDVCTENGVCDRGLCVPSSIPRALRSATLKGKIKAGAANDGIKLKLKWSTDPAFVMVGNEGLVLEIADSASNLLFAAGLAPESCVAKGASARSLSCQATGAGVSGGASIKVKVKNSYDKRSLMVIAKSSGFDFPDLSRASTVALRAQVGSDSSGSCASVFDLACQWNSRSLKCQSP